MSWFDKLMPSRIRTEQRSRSVPEGLWIKCESCSAQLYGAELKRNLYVCPQCGYHLRIGARDRLEIFLDEGSTQEIGDNLQPLDPVSLGLSNQIELDFEVQKAEKYLPKPVEGATDTLLPASETQEMDVSEVAASKEFDAESVFKNFAAAEEGDATEADSKV